MHIEELPTPAALIEDARLARNIARMQSRMDELGVRFRPHVKTSKCVEVARRQLAAGARGITVSTLKEAEQFFQAGFEDILYAVSLAPQKVAPALDLRRRGCKLQLVVDSMAAARALTEQALEERVPELVPEPVPVLIEVDVDGHRGGVAPGSALLLDIGRHLHEQGLALRGVMAHAGSSYDQRTPAQLQDIAEQERAQAVRAAERLREAGLPCPVVSIGSTPTALSAGQLPGVTEVRAGVYVFFDLVMAGVGVCTDEDIALSVLTTVIGHQVERGWVLVDAGWMAMSRDRGTQAQPVDQGYGLVCGLDGRLLDGWLMRAANQEHGIIGRRDGQAPEDLEQRFPVGSKLRVLPNHACATGAQHAQYAWVDGADVRAHWPRFGGW
jgi:D-serine deaminase-like pyridoxal phosphate-dependent protein